MHNSVTTADYVILCHKVEPMLAKYWKKTARCWVRILKAEHSSSV